jgi:hypothetical protein
MAALTQRDASEGAFGGPAPEEVDGVVEPHPVHLDDRVKCCSIVE